MKRNFPIIISFCLLSWLNGLGQSQDSLMAGIAKISTKTFQRIGTQASAMNNTITRQEGAYLSQMKKSEFGVQTSFGPNDSVKSNKILASQRTYDQMLNRVNTPTPTSELPVLKEYLPMVDSMRSALNFLRKIVGASPGLSSAKLVAIQKAEDQLQQLEGKWQQARDIEIILNQREQQLVAQLGPYNLDDKLLAINRTTFYYQQQLAEYKSILQNKDKLQEKILMTLRNSSMFQHFMQKNSYVGRLFNLPDNYGSPVTLPGLQTKDLVQGRIGLNTGSAQASDAGGDPGQYLHQKVDDGVQQISELKRKLQEIGNLGGSGDMVMPQFKPNDQHTKTFLNRLEYSVSLQTQQTYGIMPASAELGVTLGYKLSSNATVGIGGSYVIGLGLGLRHLSYSGQGAGIRSFVDVKVRCSLWLTGGLEYNYMQGFSSWQDLKNWDQWQKSALLGLTKKIKLTTNKSSNIQLLFDALYKQHIPASAPLVFRVGYSFN